MQCLPYIDEVGSDLALVSLFSLAGLMSWLSNLAHTPKLKYLSPH